MATPWWLEKEAGMEKTETGGGGRLDEFWVAEAEDVGGGARDRVAPYEEAEEAGGSLVHICRD